MEKHSKIVFFLLKLCVLCALFSWIVAYYPYYEKFWYEKTEPVTWERYREAEQEESDLPHDEFLPVEFTGYPTEGMKTELKSYEDFLSKRNGPICLEVDASRLKPTGVYVKVYDFYRPVSGSSYSKYNRTGGVRVSPSYPAPEKTGSLGAFFYRNKAIYAQYYVLSLEERDRMLVLINDTVVDVPKKGKFQLPYATGDWTTVKRDDSRMWKLILENNLPYDKYYETIYTLDASTWWFKFGIDENEFNEVRDSIAAILFLGGIGGVFVIIIWAVFFNNNIVPKED